MTTSDPARKPASFDGEIKDPSDDLLGIQPYAARLAEFVDRLAPPFTIGVYGAWGSGKTSFVRLMEAELRKLHPDLKFIAFGAWPFKTSDDLWRALVLQIATELRQVKPAAKSEPPDESFTTRLRNRLRAPAFRFDPEPPPPVDEYEDLLQRLDDTRYGGRRSSAPGQVLDETGAVTALVQGTLAALGNLSPLVAAMRGFFGVDAKVDVAKLLQHEKNETTRSRIKSVDEFREAMKELFKPDGPKVCVFIDDLDRCMPDVALDLLEALKIFLGETRCIFVIAADEQLIVEGLRIRYKEMLPTTRTYFEKIIQLGIRVPDHSTADIHRFIAAQYPQWLASTDLIQTAVGSNPRRLKQYCTWLDYKYMVVRDPQAAEDWPLLTKLVELWSRNPTALATLPQHLPEHGFSDADAAEIAEIAAFVDVIPDTQSTLMLKSRDRVLIRLFERVARTGAPKKEDVLSEDVAKVAAIVTLDPGLDAVLRQLAGSADWGDVMDSVESSLRGGAGARQPHPAAASLMAIAKANEAIAKKLIEPGQELSAVLPQIVLGGDRSAILAALDVRLRAARHFIQRRKFVKLDALAHSWPDLFQNMQTDKAGLRTFESNVNDPAQRTQDLAPRWMPYLNDEKLLAFLRLRPFVADILDEELTAISSITAAVVRTPDAAPQPATPPAPTPPAPSSPDPVVKTAAAPPAGASTALVNLFVEITFDGSRYKVTLSDERGLARDSVIDVDATTLVERAQNLRDFVHHREGDFAGRLREFGGELYDAFFADVALSHELQADQPRRICFFVPTLLERLPWELLYIRSSRLFLGLSPSHSLVRLVRLPNDRLPPPVEPPLRILAFLGKPGVTPPRLTEEEALLSQLSSADGAGKVTLEVLSGERATFSELENATRILQPHILHFSGFLDGDSAAFSDRPLSVSAFVNWLIDSRIRLVDLTGCYVPAGGFDASFASHLVINGVPMVIGTTTPVASDAVLVFARDFYRALAEGRSIEAALIDARQSQSKERWDWSAFALFANDPSQVELLSNTVRQPA